MFYSIVHFDSRERMYEVEMKVKVKDVNALLQILNEKANKDTRFQNIDIYYNTSDPQRDFSKTDEAIRIRVTKFLDENGNVKSDSADLTYKGPKLDKEIKTRIEKVVKFAGEDLEALDGILSALGLKKVIEVRKDRQLFHYHHKNYEIEIVVDTIEHLPGHYMELEIQCSEKSEITKAKDAMVKVLEEFGYSINESIRDSYLELILKQLAKK
jgi:adenylate cyclase class 2